MAEGQEVDKREVLFTPRGEAILGDVDPRTLSLAEFRTAPGLLFHGAREEYSFDGSINYATYAGVNSSTIGRGFYATDDRENAAMYSRIRQGDPHNLEIMPIVTEILPFQAHVFDFRRKDNERVNAPVPEHMLRNYTELIKKLIAEKLVDGWTEELINDPAKRSEINILQDIRSNLFDLLKANPKGADLRSMIGTKLSSENGATYFHQFMTEQGFDGAIFNEGGDHSDQKHTSSYVFFNLDHVGTYESWQDKDKKND